MPLLKLLNQTGTFLPLQSFLGGTRDKYPRFIKMEFKDLFYYGAVPGHVPGTIDSTINHFYPPSSTSRVIQPINYESSINVFAGHHHLWRKVPLDCRRAS